MGFSGVAGGEEPACQWRRHKRCRFDSWVVKIPWREAHPTHPHLENPMNKGAWQATVHSVPKSWTRLKQLCMPIMDNNHIYIQPLKELVGVVIQSLSGGWLFATPWNAAHQATISFTISQSFLKLMSIESVMPSNHFILCCPLLLSL